jgi:hypothetical protein
LARLRARSRTRSVDPVSDQPVSDNFGDYGKHVSKWFRPSTNPFFVEKELARFHQC